METIDGLPPLKRMTRRSNFISLPVDVSNTITRQWFIYDLEEEDIPETPKLRAKMFHGRFRSDLRRGVRLVFGSFRLYSPKELHLLPLTVSSVTFLYSSCRLPLLPEGTDPETETEIENARSLSSLRLFSCLSSLHNIYFSDEGDEKLLLLLGCGRFGLRYFSGKCVVLDRNVIECLNECQGLTVLRLEIQSRDFTGNSSGGEVSAPSPRLDLDLSNLRTLDVWKKAMMPRNFHILPEYVRFGRTPNLSRLRVTCSQIEVHQMENINNECPFLRFLEFGYCELQGGSYHRLFAKPSLRELSFVGCTFDATWLRRVTSILPTLEVLRLGAFEAFESGTVAPEFARAVVVTGVGLRQLQFDGPCFGDFFLQLVLQESSFEEDPLRRPFLRMRFTAADFSIAVLDQIKQKKGVTISVSDLMGQ